MGEYIVRRLLLFIPTLLGLTLLIFVILRIVPGDPAAAILSGVSGELSYTQADLDALRARLGLDRPLPVQYVSWLAGLVTLDWGRSLYNNEEVFATILKRFLLSMELALLAWIIATVLGICVGIVGAIRQNTLADYASRIFSIVGLATPTFWLGTLLILFLSRVVNWLPPPGFKYFWESPTENLAQLFWPALGLGYFLNASVGRMTRTQMLEVMRQDYIRTAVAKGLRERAVVTRHALKNALLPVVTISGIQLGHLLAGTVVMEQIFSLPGMGRLLIDSINRRDFPMTQGVIFSIGLIFVTMNLIVDLIYGWLDPRIRYR
ncbi:MAG: ABC transporter permease [Chloroflexi bacterium]|nr:ABC transporter permease [Chloroflexota bacterium]